MATLDSIIDRRALTMEEAALKSATFLKYEELLKNEETLVIKRKSEKLHGSKDPKFSG